MAQSLSCSVPAACLQVHQALKTRTDALQALSTKDSEPLVTKLPRQTGQKEVRYAHLLCGEINDEQMLAEPAESRASQRSPRVNDSEQLAGLQERVARLSAEVESLRRQFEEFKKQ